LANPENAGPDLVKQGSEGSLSRWSDVRKVYAAAARAQRQDDLDSEYLSAPGHESQSANSGSYATRDPAAFKAVVAMR